MSSCYDDFYRGFGHEPWFGRDVISALFAKGITPTFELGVDCAAFVDRAVKNTREAGMIPSPALAAMMWAAQIAHRLKF